MTERFVDVFMMSILIISTFSMGLLLKDRIFPRPELDNTPDFLKIAKDLAKNQVYTQEYNCVNFSQKLVDEYTKYGYESKVVSGWKSSGSYCKINDTLIETIPIASISNTSCAGGHAWVEVVIPIEATTGEIVKVKK